MNSVMIRNILTGLALLLCSTLSSLPASAATLSAQADSAYNKENYSLAVSLYNESIATDGASSDIYYNLGNAYYRDGKLGKAILCYERALALNPANKEARTNLDFVKTKIQDIPEDDSSFLSNLHKSISSTVSPDAWAWLTLALFIVLLGTIALYIFSSNITWRKIGFFGGGIVAVAFVYLFIIAWQTASASSKHNEAVVTVQTTNLSSAPRSSRSKTEKVVPIHEGTKIEILDSVSTPDDPHVGKWYDVKINNSSRAWLNAADVEKI